MQDLMEFLEPVPVHELNDDEGYTDGQLAKHIKIYEDELPELEEIDIVILGVTESRGNGYLKQTAMLPTSSENIFTSCITGIPI